MDGDLPTTEQSRLRRDALRVLNAIVDYWTEQALKSESPNATDGAAAAPQRFNRRAMFHLWNVDQDLTSVRESPLLARLEPSERAEWLTLWARAAIAGR